MSMADPNSHPVKHALDAAAGLTAFATLFNALPNIAAGLAAIWYLVRFYEYLRRKWKGLPQNPPTHED